MSERIYPGREFHTPTPGSLLTPNSWTKPQQWPHRHAYARRGFQHPNDWLSHGAMRRTTPLELEIVVPQEDRHGRPAVTCITHGYERIKTDDMDGCQILIRPGHFTPPQYLETEHRFEEVPLDGRLVGLFVSPEGQFSTLYYDVNAHDNVPHVPAIHQHWIMRWFACQTQPNPPPQWAVTLLGAIPPSAVVFEHEEPGFSSATLTTVPDHATQIGNTPIPPEYWQVCGLLAQGKEEDVIPSCIRPQELLLD